MVYAKGFHKSFVFALLLSNEIIQIEQTGWHKRLKSQNKVVEIAKKTQKNPQFLSAVHTIIRSNL